MDYKVKQLEIMLESETSSETGGYGAHLTHWATHGEGNAKSINLDAQAIQALIDHYKARIKVDMESVEPIIQIRDFGDGTWSIIGRVWTPQKKFYEHPSLINLTKSEAETYCAMIIAQSPTTEEIANGWTFIGD